MLPLAPQIQRQPSPCSTAANSFAMTSLPFRPCKSCSITARQTDTVCRAAQPFRSAVPSTEQSSRGSHKRHHRHAAAAAVTSENIQVEAKMIDQCRKELTITVPPQLCRAAWDELLTTARQEAKGMPGFRNTKHVPEAVLLRMFGGEPKAKEAVVENIVRSSFAEALIQHVGEDGIPGTEGIVSDMDALASSFSTSQPLSFVGVVDLQPRVVWHRSYFGLQVEVSGLMDDTEDARAANAAVQQMLRENASLQQVERPVQTGDTVVVDFEMVEASSGAPVPGLQRKAYRMELDTPVLFPSGAVQRLVGTKAGDEVTSEFQFPEDWDLVELQGVRVNARWRVRDVFELQLPELTDAMARQLQPGVSGARELMAVVRQGVAEERDEMNALVAMNALSEAVRSSCTVEVPESMLLEFGAQEYHNSLLQALEQAAIDDKAFQQLAEPEIVQNYIEQRREQLLEKLNIIVIAEDVWEREKLQLDSSLVETQLDSLRSAFAAAGTPYDEQQIEQQVTVQTKLLTVLNFLKEHSYFSVSD